METIPERSHGAWRNAASALADSSERSGSARQPRLFTTSKQKGQKKKKKEPSPHLSPLHPTFFLPYHSTLTALFYESWKSVQQRVRWTSNGSPEVRAMPRHLFSSSACSTTSKSSVSDPLLSPPLSHVVFCFHCPSDIALLWNFTPESNKKKDG